jgi:ubiquinone/menaquinone biosynthesis C-methylase UbiE
MSIRDRWSAVRLRDWRVAALPPDYDSDPARRQAWRAPQDVHELVAPELRGPVLDIGCGEGRLAALLSESVQWIGVDSSPAQVAANPHRPIVLADMRALPFRDDAFAETTHLWCLYHVDDPVTAIREANRVLKPGGRYYACTAARDNDPEMMAEGYPPTSFDAEEAAELIASVFETVNAQRWNEPFFPLETREEVRAYCRHNLIPPERAEAVALPLWLTKRGVLVRATKPWKWDASLFAGAAPYYERGRLPYAPALADAFADALQLDGGGRLLDVGCGPGTIALRVASLFEEVIGLDADPGMLAEAQRLATERRIANARWVHGRAEELPAGLGHFRAVTFAASFHWMDRPMVAAAVRTMLEPDGVVVHVDNRHQNGFGTVPGRSGPPGDGIQALRRAYLGDDRRAGAGVRNSSPDDEDDVFRAAGFEGPEVVVVPDGRVIERTVTDVIAEVFSMSSTAPHLFGSRVTEFETELRVLLEQAATNGTFTVVLPDNELKIWRPTRSTQDE